MDNITKAKELFLDYLIENNANDIKEVDDSCEQHPFFYQVRGVINGRLMNAVFNYTIDKQSGINFDYKELQHKELSYKEFIQVLSDIKIDKPEYTLERYEIKENEQWVISKEDGAVFIELKNKN